MGPKKNKGKKKSEKPEVIDEEKHAILQKVKDQILVNQMNELSKLRQLIEAANTANLDMTNEMRQVERDSEGIIAFLRRRLGGKCEEEDELMEINNALVQEKTEEKNTFLETMKMQEQKYNEMSENLTSEIKALNGRLGNVEEYREQRDVLLDKNNKMESYLVTMEGRAHAIEKEYEKANLIDKDRMRREMEEKLKKFSVDFQRATKARIAMATQNVIKENIAINNELSLLIASWQKLHDENESLRAKNRHASNDIATERDIREMLMKKNVAQEEMIDRLAYEYMKVDETHKECDQLRRILNNLQSSIEQNEKAKKQAKSKSQQIIQDNMVLESRVNGLRGNLEKLTYHHGRNAALMRRARAELDDNFILDKKKSVLYTDDYLRRLGEVFGRLEELFSEDWIFDVTASQLVAVSVDTIIGPLSYKTAKNIDAIRYSEKESVDTAEHQRNNVHSINTI